MEAYNNIEGTELLEWALWDLDRQAYEQLTDALLDLHPAEIAGVLESLPPEQRKAFWSLVPDEWEGEILTCVGEEVRASIIGEMDRTDLVAAAESMDAEDLAEVLEELPEDLTDAILVSLDKDYRTRIEEIRSYEEGTAGRLMSADVISVRKNVSLAVVLRWLRRHNTLPPHTDALMVIDEAGSYLGKLSMADVVTQDPGLIVEEVMQTEAEVVRVDSTDHEVAALFERRDLISVAVLEDAGRLLGRITIDDVVDVIREAADRALLQSAGLNQDEDLFAPVIASARRRGLWLGINLLTVFAAAWVIGRFEEA